MATDKKHIAVYLDPAVEQALIAFCQEKGLISKKGTMYSAGVNAALAQFFNTVDAEASNIPAVTGNTPTKSSIPDLQIGTIPASIGNTLSNTPSRTLAVEELPGKFESPSEDEIEAALVDAEAAKKHAQIYGFTPDEALADAYFQINMLTSNYDGLEDRHEALKKELLEVRSQIEQERASREEIETQLSERDEEVEKLRSELADLKQNSAAASKDLPEAADLLNQLKAKRKKSTVTLADVEKILEIIGGDDE